MLPGGAEAQSRRGAEAHPGTGRDTCKGLLTGLPEKRQPRVLLVLAQGCPMPALWVEETRRPHSGGRVLRPQRYLKRGPPSRPAVGSVSSLSPLPRGRGPSIARSSAPAARQLSARSCPGPVVRACSRSKSAAEKDVGFCPLGLGEGEGLLQNRGPVPVARSGYLHCHTAPFLLPGRPQPWGRVLPVHPKCLPGSPRFGVFRYSDFCEPRRPRSPVSTIGWPPPAVAVVPGCCLGVGEA